MSPAASATDSATTIVTARDAAQNAAQNTPQAKGVPRRVLVYGLGRSGSAVARLLRRQGFEVWTFDAREPQSAELTALGCRATPTPLVVPIDLCVAAPGVPWNAPDLVALRARGLETIGEVEWVYRSVDAPILGITGTAGKSTVTRWLSEALTRAGLDAPAGGNVDPALSAVAEPGRVLVTELSSFQLERCPTLHPRVAVLLNLGRDHLDRHGSLTAYQGAKKQLIAHLSAEDTLIYNHDDPTLRSWAEASPARSWGFSASPGPVAAAYLEDRGGLDGETLVLHGEPLLAANALRLSGRHHHLNALAVALACSAQGLPLAAIREGLEGFAGVPGRYSLVAERAGVRFIEDSVATRTLAVQAALEATPAPVVWLVGGQDKGASLAELEALVREKVVLCIGLGEAGPAFAAQIAAWTETYLVTEKDGDRAMTEAVVRAAARLQQTGGTVLLAPLAASFDQFKDYRARADAFRRAAQKLTGTTPETASDPSQEARWTGL